MEEQSKKASENIFNEKWAQLSSKVLIGAVSVIFAVVGMMYSEVKQRLYALEEKVSYLQVDKISREEFKLEFIELRKELAENRADSALRDENMKREIIDRINLLMKIAQSGNN